MAEEKLYFFAKFIYDQIYTYIYIYIARKKNLLRIKNAVLH